MKRLIGFTLLAILSIFSVQAAQQDDKCNILVKYSYRLQGIDAELGPYEANLLLEESLRTKGFTLTTGNSARLVYEYDIVAAGLNIFPGGASDLYHARATFSEYAKSPSDYKIALEYTAGAEKDELESDPVNALKKLAETQPNCAEVLKKLNL